MCLVMSTRMCSRERVCTESSDEFQICTRAKRRWPGIELKEIETTWSFRLHLPFTFLCLFFSLSLWFYFAKSSSDEQSFSVSSNVSISSRWMHFDSLTSGICKFFPLNSSNCIRLFVSIDSIEKYRRRESIDTIDWCHKWRIKERIWNTKISHSFKRNFAVDSIWPRPRKKSSQTMSLARCLSD